MMDASRRHETIAELSADHRCEALAPPLTAGDAACVARVALVSCNAFDNFPPGLTGKARVPSGKLSPAMVGLFMQQLRLWPARRLPIAFGWLTKRGDRTTVR